MAIERVNKNKKQGRIDTMRDIEQQHHDNDRDGIDAALSAADTWDELSDIAKRTLQSYFRTDNKVRAYAEALHPLATYNEISQLSTDRSLKTRAKRLFSYPSVIKVIDYVQEKAREKAAQDLPKLDAIIDGIKDTHMLSHLEVNTAVINSQWTLARASLIADFNIKKFMTVDEKGNAFYDFSKATDVDWFCLSEVTYNINKCPETMDRYPVDSVKLKPYDKLKALEIVAKHIGVNSYGALQQQAPTAIGQDYHQASEAFHKYGDHEDITSAMKDEFLDTEDED